MSEISILTKPLNFDNWTCRASQAGKVTGEPAGKNPMQKYLDAFSLIQKLEEKASSGKKLTVNQQEDLLDAKSQIDRLKERRNDIILSQTAKSYCKEVYWSTRTNRIKKIHSMYMENGKLGEPYAIDLISQLDDPDLYEMGMPVYEKCTLPRQFNNHFEGECDIKKSPSIQDIKCNWDISTYFPHVNELVLGGEDKPRWIFNEKENVWELPANNIENSDYECQGIVYMELYGESSFLLRYCLVNMPNELVEQNLKFILRDFGGDTSNPAFATACEEFRKEHDFSDLPISARVCTFKIERNNDKYLEMCKKVEAARVYLNWYSEQMFYFENPKEVGKFGIEAVIKEQLNESFGEVKQISSEFNKETETLNVKAVVVVENPVKEVKVEFCFSEPESKYDPLTQLVVDAIINCTTEDELTALYLKQKEFIEISGFKEDLIAGFKNKKILINEIKPTEEDIIDSEFAQTEGDIVSENATEGGYTEDQSEIIDGQFPEIDEVTEVDENITAESNFPEVLDEIKPTETEDIDEPTSHSEQEDAFLLSIQNLKNIDDAVAFYMDNAGNIDDTKYEAIYFAKKDELSNPVDAPKIVKPKIEKADKAANPTSPASNFTVPEKTYDGTERYVIILSDTEKSEPLPFETAKGVILSHLSNSFTAWNTVKTHRDGVLAFYQSNKEVIDREKEFREQVSLLSKNEVERLVEIKKKEITSQLK